MEAIRIEILGKTDRLIEKAVADDAGKYALSTLDKAKTAREKANTIISKDRYNREDAIVEANRAEYEARHASNISLSVRALNRNDQAWEKLMLIYEIQMNRIGKEVNLENLPFDNGPLAAADTLIMFINNLQDENEQLKDQMTDLSGNVTTELQALLSLFDESSDESNPIELTKTIRRHVEKTIDENRSLSEQIQSSQSQLATLEAEHGSVTDQLSTRLEREEKFKKAKQMLNPSEGEVLFNSANDIVLRLSGLSFDVNKSDIKDSHMPLLEKVKKTIQLFPDALIRVEGHTDDNGEASRNVLLSEKRALAVMQYLRQSLLIPATKISSVGYGADHPVASNQTEEGRAKNRRIDIILMR
jgi:outer membrane protein OmpA-like peptidoglycan-associated protein